MRRIIASDISAGSLEAAKRTAAKYGVTDLITFIVAPGLDGLKDEDVDTIVIAGVGGETIIGIIEDSPLTKRRDLRLILQPQTKIAELYFFLKENGYVILDTKRAMDRGRVYTIILTEGGG